MNQENHIQNLFKLVIYSNNFNLDMVIIALSAKRNSAADHYTFSETAKKTHTLKLIYTSLGVAVKQTQFFSGIKQRVSDLPVALDFIDFIALQA